MLEKLKVLYPSSEIEILEYQSPMTPCILLCKKCGKKHYYPEARRASNKINFCDCDKYFKNARDKISYLSEIFEYEVLDSTNLNHMSCKCLRCGKTWKTYAGVLTKGSRCNCHSARKMTAEQFQSRTDSRFGGKNYEVLDYRDWETKIHIRHSICGFIWAQSPQHFIEGCGCPKCCRKQSRGETEIRVFLENNKINFLTQYRIGSDKERLYCDFYLPEHNLVIEYQGEQHYFPVPTFGGQKGFESGQKRDERKRLLLQEAGIELLEIPYWDLRNISNILTSKFNDYRVTEQGQATRSEKQQDIV